MSNFFKKSYLPSKNSACQDKIQQKEEIVMATKKTVKKVAKKPAVKTTKKTTARKPVARKATRTAAKKAPKRTVKTANRLIIEIV